MGVHVARQTDFPFIAFRDREDAGDAIVEYMGYASDENAFVLALPRGGIPVARPVADALGAGLHPVFVRKLAIPSSPEMGFGAVTVSGTVELNQRIVQAFGLDAKTIDRVVQETLQEVRRRARAYPGGYPLPDLTGRPVVLVDDGLATGFTALAAAKMLREQGAGRLVLAVPVSPSDSLQRLALHVDEAYCLIEQIAPSFAVASYYRRFPDLADAEIVALLDPA